MAASDVIAQDGGHANVKLHPYLITLVRWCVSCLWSTASVLLHRLVATPLPRLPQITAGKQARAAGSEHLHPEPRVECVVLHAPPAPAAHALDVVFVHGLYGSLGNTWRQGEWRTKYKLDPTSVPLRNHSSEPCGCEDQRDQGASEPDLSENTFAQLNAPFPRVLRDDSSLITENFYSNTLLRDANHFDTQAEFVTELFKTDCDTHCDRTFKCTCDGGDKCDCKVGEASRNECKCVGSCAAGCGCTCDACYSACWPRDWLREDFPGARVISVNYTSDPYLWRPLWVKPCKRLRLHERAQQMSAQLLALGVGRRPVVWVGHSKGGLFIKQIYCEAYEAYLKINKSDIKNNNSEDQSDREFNKNKNNVHSIDKYRFSSNDECRGTDNDRSDATCDNLLNDFIKEHNSGSRAARGDADLRSIDDMNEIRNNHNSGNNSFKDEASRQYSLDVDNSDMFSCAQSGNEHEERARHERVNSLSDDESGGRGVELSSNDDEDRARLWAQSRGFMFYSVPHAGSPLADIKAPLTSRSVELQEIAKDCPLVRELQARWLAACAHARPHVRGVVETARTLMSVLWLRIVSEDSADAGVGVLHGVSVDHREICKPASRRCLLYTELTRLIRAALGQCRCH